MFLNITVKDPDETDRRLFLHVFLLNFPFLSRTVLVSTSTRSARAKAIPLFFESSPGSGAGQTFGLAHVASGACIKENGMADIWGLFAYLRHVCHKHRDVDQRRHATQYPRKFALHCLGDVRRTPPG